MESMVGPTPVFGEGTSTPSGLRYWELKTGSGTPATGGKAVKIHYTLWLDTGKKIVSSVELGQPFIFEGQTIKGWGEVSKACASAASVNFESRPLLLTAPVALTSLPRIQPSSAM